MGSINPIEHALQKLEQHHTIVSLQIGNRIGRDVACRKIDL